MRVLATIVVPPHMSVSGGARAGELLSNALATHCEMTVASMMNGAGVTDCGGQGATRISVRSWLPPIAPWSRLSNRYSTLFYRSNIPEIVCDGRFDLVHIHNPMPALEMERVARACIKSRTPYVVSTHGFNEVANGAQIYGFDAARRLVWKTLVEAPVARVVARASGIFALSAADFDIVRSMGYSGPELSIVTNGVPTPEPASVESDALLLDRIGIPSAKVPGQTACMFLANHTPNKGLPVLLDAFAKLERPYLLIIGGEKRADVDYESYVRGCRPGQKIIVTGRLGDAEVGAALRRADLFVFPTLADTFPLVVLEAMAHGLPVLASRVGGIPHQLTDHCGVLVAPGDAAALRAAVDRLAEQPERLAVMGRHARARAASNFSWAAAANEAAKAYRRILRLHSAPQGRQPVAQARGAAE
ncbi:MAG: glycosyltransferase family 4 protein [Hyphomicrobium sp.]|jgi:glycosyltransferase involved in cell wall biosynthesis